MNAPPKSTLKILRGGCLWYETLILPAPDDVLQITGNSKGNLPPGLSHSLTVREAISCNSWDTQSGTLRCTITLHPDHYPRATTIHMRDGIAYGYEDDAQALALHERFEVAQNMPLLDCPESLESPDL